MTAELIHILQEVRAAVPHIDWQKLYEAAMLEMNPDKLPTCIGAAEQAIAQRESLVDITELERRKLADARSTLALPVQLAAQHTRYKLIDIGTFGGPASYLTVPGLGSGFLVLNNLGVLAGKG